MGATTPGCGKRPRHRDSLVVRACGGEDKRKCARERFKEGPVGPKKKNPSQNKLTRRSSMLVLRG